MKRILQLSNSDAPFVQDVMNLTSKNYEVDIISTLEEALLTELYPYDAVVFDMIFRRGNFNNTGELGLYPVQIPNHLKGKELYPWISEDSPLAEIRTSDHASGWLFTFLARLPRTQGGLEYRGGLAAYTDMAFSEVKAMFDLIGCELRDTDEPVIFPSDVLFIDSYNSPIKEIIKNIQVGVEKVSNFYYEQSMDTEYLEKTPFGTN